MSIGGCGPYGGSFIDAWLQGDWQAAFTCPVESQIGTAAFAAFLYGGLMMSLYIRTQSAVLPLVVSILGGTIAISQLPAAYQQVVGLSLMLGFAVAGYLVYRRAQTVA